MEHINNNYYVGLNCCSSFNIFMPIHIVTELCAQNGKKMYLLEILCHCFSSVSTFLILLPEWCIQCYESQLLLSVNFPPTLNVSCYRTQRSSVVYFPMMLSTMWLTPLRGEGNQPFHLQRRGNVEVLTDSVFSSAVKSQSKTLLFWSEYFTFRTNHFTELALVNLSAYKKKQCTQNDET